LARDQGEAKARIVAKISGMRNTLLAVAAAAALASTTSVMPAAAQPLSQVDTVTTALNSIPDIIFYKDTQGVYRGGNTAWAALLGKPLNQLIGKTDLDLFPEEMAKSFQAYDKAMLAAGTPTRNNEWLVYPDGKRVYVETLKTPWLGQDGQVLGVLGICHPIKPDSAPKP
jgi:PAS domain S-box-containing protein